MKIVCIDDDGFFVIPDTALLRNNEPFHVPGFADGVEWRKGRVVRIWRVAKCVERRFAHRYYGEMCAAVDFTARGAGCLAAARGFDRSFAVGTRLVPCTDDDVVDSHIEEVTRFVTLKIGDLLFIPTPGERGEAVPGARLTAAVNGEILLDFEVR